MIYLVIYVLLSCGRIVSEAGQSADSSVILVMFWNLENFFDYVDGGAGESDKEFSPAGSRHWTSSRFYKKCNSIAKSIMWIADKYGRFPDVIGVSEVENRYVLDKLVYNTLLRRCGYSVLHRESPDHRGIDVALLWRKDRLRLIQSGIRRLESMRTRDILIADMKKTDNGERIVFVVNHFPSKYGGAGTADRRNIASKALKEVCDSVMSDGTERVVAMGDFNDIPSSLCFEALRPVMYNMADSFEKDGRGTIRFNGKWDMIDMFWVSDALKRNAVMDIVEIPFLMVWDNVYSGVKPFRTYSGPRYLGGVSDHCPVILTIK